MRELVIMVSVIPGLLGAAKGKTDGDGLQGNWTVISSEANGKAAPPDAIRDQRWIIKGNRILCRRAGENAFELTFALVPAQKPTAIDLTNRRRQERVQGIYRLEENTLTLCVSAPGEKRPMDFVSGPNLKRVVFVLERSK